MHHDHDDLAEKRRGLADYVEVQMADTNRVVGAIETVLLIARPENAFISSRYIRDIALNGGDASAMVSKSVAEAISKKK
ncbi:MAG: hypothetical protein ACKOEH_04620 [Actinomycetota bacterium]